MKLVNGIGHDDYFVQQLGVDSYFLNSSRLEFFAPIVTGKKVLHVGCVDWPITDKNNSLHVQLSPYCTQLDGVDVNQEGAEQLQIPNGEIYFDWSKLDEPYDLIICPEVVEHVGDFTSFFKNLDGVSGELVLTAPCAYRCQNFFESRADEFLEVVHPDHNCWFSPYTLTNIIHKYSRRRVSSLHWLNRISIAAVAV